MKRNELHEQRKKRQGIRIDQLIDKTDQSLNNIDQSTIKDDQTINKIDQPTNKIDQTINYIE